MPRLLGALAAFFARLWRRPSIAFIATFLLISIGSFLFVPSASAVYYNLGSFWKKNAASSAVSQTGTLLSAGGNYSCALLPDGTARCWGLNTSGQLGNGSTVQSSTPVTVSVLSGAAQVAAGPNHSCALLSDGTARCWGSNSNGQLGNGSTTSSTTPVTVSGLSGAVQIAAGSSHSCAVLSDGTARCWGFNSNGELGNGNNTNSPTPVSVSGLSGAVSAAAAQSHSCAVLSDGTTRCWGFNSYGQLGNGSTTASTTPVTVSGLSGAVSVAGGASHSCARLSDGTARCWGYNASGQLGNASTAQSTIPVTVSGLSGAAQIAVAGGTDQTCAALSDGTARCWGSNSNGQLGNGSTANSTVPVTVSGLSGAVSVAGGYTHNCALLSDGTARCWGSNSNGQLGNGSGGMQSSTPVTVSILSGAVQIAAGSGHSCAILSDGGARCWGPNSSGQLGNGSASTQSATPVTVSGLSGAAQIAGGSNHTCSILSGGTARCWGANSDGQLGNGSTTGSTIPVTVSGLSGAVSVAGGSYHSCASLSNGTARCWGYNGYGQLGNGSITGSTIPVTVSGLSGAAQVVVGTSHSCALLSDGTARCWGYNGNGQLGNGSTANSTTLVTVSGLSGAAQIAAGQSHSCALLSDGTARCWGYNSNGQLGNGSTTDSTIPVTVSGLSGAVQVAAGTSHSCALLSDGTARCWGFNSDGQLGNGSIAQSTIPVTVSGVNGAVSVAAGQSHTCAVLSDGTARCSGTNSYGQLGNPIPIFLTGNTQVYGYDRNTSSPISGISGTSPITADGAAQSVVSIQLTQGSGAAWSGVTPTFTASDTLGENVPGACSVTNSSGVSSCTLQSSYAEIKELWLTSPIQALAYPTPGVTFTPGSATKLVLSGSNSLSAGSCSSMPYELALTDAQGNLVQASANFTATLSGLGSAVVYSDPRCTQVLGTSLGFLNGSSAWNFYLKDGIAETLTVLGAASGIADGVLTINAVYSSTFSSITGTTPVLADGVSASSATITLKNPSNVGVQGVTPSFSASGTGNTYGTCSSTNASGVSTCTLKSTKAETKTLSITTPLALAGGNVTFSAGPASLLAFSQTPSASATLGTAFSTQPIVQVRDASGNPIGSGTQSIALSAFTDSGCSSVASGTLSSSGSGITVSATAGSATFTGVRYLSSLIPIYLKASSSGLTSACTGPITLGTFLASGTGNNAGGATTLTLTAPAGVAAGQLLFAVVSARTAGTTVTGVPTGWTSIDTRASAASVKQIVYWKLATGSEPATYTFTLSASVKAAGAVLAYAGINTTSPFELASGQANTTSTSIVAPGLSPVQSSSVLLGFYGIAYTTTITVPGGFTSRGTDISTGNPVGSNIRVLATDKILTTSGATGPSTATGVTAAENIGQVIILKLQ